MSAFTFYIRRAVYRLSLIMAIFCCIEIFMHLTEGTKPNYQFPWGHYVESIAGMAILFGLIAWLTKIGPRGYESPAQRSE